MHAPPIFVLIDRYNVTVAKTNNDTGAKRLMTKPDEKAREIL